MTTPNKPESPEPNQPNQEELLTVFRQRPINDDRLKECGRVYGFGNQFGRNLAWNYLISKIKFDQYADESFEKLKQKATESGVKHKYVYQIHIDVERSLNSIDVYANLTEAEIKYHRENLEDLLQVFFTLHLQYSYYQGFHDVGTVLLYTLGKDAAFRAMQKLAYVYFRDALKYPFEQSVTLQLRLILRIVHVFDAWFADTISYFYEGVPIFAVPWILTWFSHSLKDINTISRIFDYLVSSPPYSIIYMCAAVLLMLKEDLLGTAKEIDMGCLHSFFQHLEIPNVELLISTTIELERVCNIDNLISKLEKPFPDQSIIASSKHSGMINKYYKHKLQKRAQAILPKHRGKLTFLKKPIITGLLVAILLVLFTIISRHIFNQEEVNKI